MEGSGSSGLRCVSQAVLHVPLSLVLCGCKVWNGADWLLVGVRNRSIAGFCWEHCWAAAATCGVFCASVCCSLRSLPLLPGHCKALAMRTARDRVPSYSSVDVWTKHVEFAEIRKGELLPLEDVLGNERT